MSQGKAFTGEQKKQAVDSLQAFLELGFSRNKACEMVGLNPSTLSRWIDADETLGMKVQGWENAMNKLAMANLRDAMLKEAEMDDNRKETSKWWAERKMKDDGFSTRTESTGKDGAPINFFINPELASKNGINPETT